MKMKATEHCRQYDKLVLTPKVLPRTFEGPKNQEKCCTMAPISENTMQKSQDWSQASCVKLLSDSMQFVTISWHVLTRRVCK